MMPLRRSLFSCVRVALVLPGAITATLCGQVSSRTAPGTQMPRVIKVERTVCAGSVIGRNRDGSSYAWNCRGLPMIRLTLDDGSMLGPMIGVTLDAIGDPLS